MTTDVDETRRIRFTRGDFDRIRELDIFPGQRLELIDGELIDKSGQPPAHAKASRELRAWFAEAFGAIRTRVGMPVDLAEADRAMNWVAPDAALLAKANPEYCERHPRGDEILLAVEVSDTTVRFDATWKRDLYARAGVPEYWVLDLPGRRLIVHRDLREGQYQNIDTLSEHDTASPASHPEASIPVALLLT